MTGAVYYPPADRTSRWYGNAYPGSPIDPNCFCWHTTETGGVPYYGGGASAPHWTYDPDTRRVYQHFRADRSARALRNVAGGVETNTLNVLQVEIVCYSDETLAVKRGHLPVSKLTDTNLADLGKLARWALDEWGVRLDIDPGWVRSNYLNPTRMTFTQWRNFYGHTGHNRVPENVHWDPGRLDIDTLIGHARGTSGSGGTTTTKEEDMPAPKDWDATDWAAFRQNAALGVLGTDDIVESDNPENPFYALKTFITSMFKRQKRIEQAVVDTAFASPSAAGLWKSIFPDKEPAETMRRLIEWTWVQSTQGNQQAATAVAKLGALEAVVAAHVASGGSLTVEQITAAAKAGAEQALAEGVDIRVTVNDQESSTP